MAVLMVTAHPAAADYSDPGPLATSTVPAVSTHPQSPAPRTGGLADTGSQATTLARIGVLFLFAGGVLFLASSKREQHRHG